MWKLICCVTLLFITDVVVCKPDYLFDREVNGWLNLHKVPATWQQAFLNCHNEGAVLASPINAELATALRRITSKSNLDNPIFLGVNAFSKGDFMSIEGVPLADLSITWGTYGDGKTPEDCLSLSTDGKTYITSCTLSLPYICYKKRDDTTHTIINRCGTFDDGEKIEDLFNTWHSGNPKTPYASYPCVVMSQRTLYNEYCDHRSDHWFPFVCEKDPRTLRFEKISREVYAAATEAGTEAATEPSVHSSSN